MMFSVLVGLPRQCRGAIARESTRSVHNAYSGSMNCNGLFAFAAHVETVVYFVSELQNLTVPQQLVQHSILWE